MTTRNPITWVRHAARNSPWLLIAVSLHLIVIAGAAVFYTTKGETPVDEGGFKFVPQQAREFVAPVELPPLTDRHAPTDLTKDTELLPIDPDAPTITDAASSEPLGEPDATLDFRDVGGSTAIGPGRTGSLTDGVSSETGTGKFPGRPKGVPDGGGSGQPCELAVLQGLRWLARHQNPDGSWSAEGLKRICGADSPCFDPKAQYTSSFDEGLTGIALLAFLGRGISHESKAFLVDPVTKKKYVSGDIVKKGLLWLVERQNPEGSFSKGRPFLYNEALATMAMCEAYGLTQARFFREPAQRAVDFLQGAQRPNPSGQGLWGWRYAARQEIERFHQGDTLDAAFKRELYDADTSVTGWCVMALKSAQLSGLNVNQESLDGGLAFCNWVTADNGLVGYIDPKGAGATVTGPDDHFLYHPASMSALGMCIRAFTTHDVEDPALEPAAKQIAADLPRVSKDRLSIDYYYWYYGSLALNQFDGPDSPRRNGKYWNAWRKAMETSLTALQEESEKSCNHGGWIVPDRWCHSGGPIYATAINVLTLEVYYRYENAFGAVRREVKKGEMPAGQKK